MATEYTSHKVTALPGLLVPNAMYWISDPSDSTKMTIHLVNSAGTSTRTFTSSGGGSSNPPSSTVLTTTTLSAITQDVVINTINGAFNIYLPPVASEVEIRFFYSSGSSRVWINENQSDPNNIVLGRNRIRVNAEYDTMVLKAIAGKWFAI